MTATPVIALASAILAAASSGARWPDAVNGGFDLAGGAFAALNVYRVWRDRSVAGVSVTAGAFFAVWGYWNIFYYPHLGQWWSFAGGLTVTLANTAWVVLALRYGRKDSREGGGE
jgi:hypothetical protein